MPFSVEVLSFDEAVHERGHVRHCLRLPIEGTLATPGGALVHNLSSTGLLIETSDHLTIGEVIQIDLPEASARSARVVWHSGNLFGCQFELPLGKAAVSAALLRSPPPDQTEPLLAPSPQNSAPMKRSNPDVDSEGFQRLPLATRMWVIIGLGLAPWVLLGIPVALVALS